MSPTLVKVREDKCPTQQWQDTSDNSTLISIVFSVRVVRNLILLIYVDNWQYFRILIQRYFPHNHCFVYIVVISLGVKIIMCIDQTVMARQMLVNIASLLRRWTKQKHSYVYLIMIARTPSTKVMDPIKVLPFLRCFIFFFN